MITGYCITIVDLVAPVKPIWSKYTYNTSFDTCYGTRNYRFQ